MADCFIAGARQSMKDYGSIELPTRYIIRKIQRISLQKK